MRVNVGDEKRSKRKLPAAAAAADEGDAKPQDAKPATARHSKLQLKCMDGSVFDVTYEQAMMSSTLWVLMQDVSGKKPKNGIKQHIIPMEGVPTDSVQRALDYCSCLYMQQVDRLETAMLDWEDEFVGLESKELCDLAKVASNLDIQPLVDLTCRSIAQIMSATSEADELRKKFGLEDPHDVECSCELRSDMAGFDFDMFNSMDHDLSTEEYELVEFDQPSVDELVSFINGSGSNPNVTPGQLQQQQAAAASKKNCHLHGENSSDPGDSNNGSTTSSKKKRKKRKKKKSPPPSREAIDQADAKSMTAVEENTTGSDKHTQDSSSSDEEKEEPDREEKKVPSSKSTKNAKNSKPQTLEEKVRLARQNPSAVFKESQFEDDDDEDMAKVIKMFELNLESAYRECDNKKKPRLDFAPREVFRSSLVRSSQFDYVQRRLSATMT
ncbi:SKP1-like protein 21 [Phytophthora cinnamomi]|uniref:SKP1-like protein 21 n=1 Tax=Phytophthora cinnamomi TaxID=4785 RepID=UPI00355A5DC3|nr:SKP1-like protein 21 [Phytophthora cinnamomi]